MTVEKKRILLVDDDPMLLEHLNYSLCSYHAFEIVTATDGNEAVEALSGDHIDLVVTDVQMPGMDGFALVSHISQNFSRLPVVIITAHASPSMEHKLNRIGIMAFEKKPIDVDRLANRIFDLLVGVDCGYLQGISVPSFLQILQADCKTCSLKISNGERNGFLHLLNGQVLDAEFDGEQGEKAAMALISWDEPLTIDIQPVVRLKETTIERDTTFLIMDSLRQKDEGDLPDEAGLSSIIPGLASGLASWSAPTLAPVSTSEGVSECGNCGLHLLDITDDDRAFYKTALKVFTDVKGYKASAAMTHDGRLIAVQTFREGLDISQIARTANEMFCGIQRRAVTLGIGPLEETVFRTREAIVLVRCLGWKEGPHVHLITIGIPAGEGLLRIRLKRLVTSIIEEKPSS